MLPFDAVTTPVRVALVTGAGSGIGRAVALGLLRSGYAVALVGRRREALEGTARAAGDASDVMVLPADVTDAGQVTGAFDAVRQRHGRLDLLFNNAGVAPPSVPLEDLTPTQWRAVVDVNLTGAFLCLQQAFRVMKLQDPRGGRIINNGSIAAHVPRPQSAPYAATKHAITGLTRAAGLDGRAFDIAVGQIDIGNATTDMAQSYSGGVLQPNGTTAPEPLIDIDHVVGAVLYMAGLPLSVNVPFVTVMATKMPYLGRG
ncbi:MAG TPA: SDR family oxidoreductase [Luteitalea sp.]|nr:SDR family oxidoreductase [Luteitalea sp.]